MDSLYRERDYLISRGRNPDDQDRIRKIDNEIHSVLFMDDYAAVVIDHVCHYDDMIRDGFKINGKTYRRISCSAGQARQSTVIFCCDEIIDEVRRRIDNGRNLMKPIAPSKYNAYFG